MSTSYKQLGIPFFKEVFTIIDEVLTDNHAPYYLIGYNAIALEFLKQGIKPSRGTKDIDFALMVSTIREFDRLVNEFEKRGFNKAKAPWTLFHQGYNVAIDILPFGQIAQQDTEDFNKRYANLHVLGFVEVLEKPLEIQMDEFIVNVPPLHGMILLKLIAWSDRPEDRDNDLTDILNIFDHFYDFGWNEIADEHYDLFDNEPIDNLKIAARVMGRKAKQYLDRSMDLKIRILDVLNDYESSNSIARKWRMTKDSTIEYLQGVLSEYRIGINEDILNSDSIKNLK